MEELTSGPFEEHLAWPQGLCILPDPLTVDWQAMKEGRVQDVLAVVEKWRSAVEYGHLYGHVWPYDSLDIWVDGKWEHAVHLDRATFWLVDKKQKHPSLPSGYSWRHHQSRPNCKVLS